VLVTNKYDKDTLVSFKLVNGDEVIAKVVEETADEFIVSKPMIVVPSPQGIGLMQSLFTSELNKSIHIDKRHVMLHAQTSGELINHYIHTTTGIEPVGAGSIIT
jgi:hypothetical protein